MTRDEKIEALATAFDIEDIGWSNERDLGCDSFRQGILAGIKLRDEELLASSNRANELLEKVKIEMFLTAWRDENIFFEIEQYLKAIKGETK
jgi:hypothetical protein